MKTIYKYPFKISAVVEIDLPFGSRVLTIQPQGNEVFLWALVDSEEKQMLKSRFCVYGTGQPAFELISYLRYFTTIQVNGFVWHIFQ